MFRSWVFTINNPTFDDGDELEELKNSATYLIYGVEVGESGTEHFQGYAEFGIPKRLQTVKNLLTRAHWEPRRGTQKQAIDYCKKDGVWTEDGTPNQQGKRNDLEEAKVLIESGGLKNVATEMFSLYVRCHRGLEAYQRIIQPRRETWTDVKVYVFWGPSGSGKTRRVFETEKPENLFVVNPHDNFPFDGYNGEEAILFDDFYGKIPREYMYRLLDGHPNLRLNIKGGHVYANWSRVYITSNQSPKYWYAEGLGALERRITNVTEVGGNTVAPTCVTSPLEDNIDIDWV